MSLPLFPDFLDLCDPFGRQSDHVRAGHGVWSIVQGFLRRASENGSETVWLVVVYDDQRTRFLSDKDSKHWTVEIRHYHNSFESVSTGWGKSRSVKQQMRQQVRFVCKSFVNRDSATDFVGKLLAVFDRVKARADLDSVS